MLLLIRATWVVRIRSIGHCFESGSDGLRLTTARVLAQGDIGDHAITIGGLLPVIVGKRAITEGFVEICQEVSVGWREIYGTVLSEAEAFYATKDFAEGI